MEKWRGEWVERGWVPPWKERLIPNLCAPRKGGEEVSIQMAEVLRECWCGGDVRVHVSIDLWHTALFRQNHLKPLFSLLEAWCGTTAVTNPSLVATKDLTLASFSLLGELRFCLSMMMHSHLAPTTCWLKNPTVLLPGLRAMWWLFKLTSDNLPFQLVMSFASSLSLLFSEDQYSHLCFFFLSYFVQKSIKNAYIHPPPLIFCMCKILLWWGSTCRSDTHACRPFKCQSSDV